VLFNVLSTLLFVFRVCCICALFTVLYYLGLYRGADKDGSVGLLLGMVPLVYC
jgi:hypothetical protein